MAAHLPQRSPSTRAGLSTYVRTQVGLPPSAAAAQTLSKETRAHLAGKPDWKGKPFGPQALLDSAWWTSREQDFDPVARLYLGS